MTCFSSRDVVGAIDGALLSLRKSGMLVSHSLLGAIAAEKWVGVFSGFASPVGVPTCPCSIAEKCYEVSLGGDKNAD